MRARRILLVDDSGEFRTEVRDSLAPAFAIREADSAAAFRREFRPRAFDLVILDMRLESGREGLGLLREILAQDELQPVIMVSAYGDTDAVLDATEAGALMFLHKHEFTPELLARMVEAVLQQARVRRHLAALQRRVQVDDPLRLTAGDPAVLRAAQQADRAADDPAAVVLLSGATGAGHDLVAAGIHSRSARRSAAPFVVAGGGGDDAGALREAFLGAARADGTGRRKGLIEEAGGGALFVARFSQLEAGVREAVVKAFADRLIEGSPPITVDAQLIVGATSAEASGVADAIRGHWPSARLVEVALPSLRERRGDLPLLAACVLQEMRREGRTTARAFGKGALQAIESWPWPGNLHELQAAVRYAAVQALTEDADEIERGHLPTNMTEPAAALNGSGTIDIHSLLARTEAGTVARVIDAQPGKNKTQLAGALGYTDRYAFGRRMRKLLADHPEMGKEFPKLAALFR